MADPKNLPGIYVEPIQVLAARLRYRVNYLTKALAERQFEAVEACSKNIRRDADDLRTLTRLLRMAGESEVSRSRE